jgi:hypothetical protein
VNRASCRRWFLRTRLWSPAGSLTRTRQRHSEQRSRCRRRLNQFASCCRRTQLHHGRDDRLGARQHPADARQPRPISRTGQQQNPRPGRKRLPISQQQSASSSTGDSKQPRSDYCAGGSIIMCRSFRQLLSYLLRIRHIAISVAIPAGRSCYRAAENSDSRYSNGTLISFSLFR